VCIVKDASKKLLNVFFVGFVKFGTCVDWVSSLIVLSILDRVRVVRAMLWLCRMWVLIPEYLFSNVGGHCYFNISFIILVQSERDTTIENALPIFNNFICFCPKGSKEKLEVFVTNIFDAKVVHAQVEPDGL
jgi:hypothetical protein